MQIFRKTRGRPAIYIGQTLMKFRRGFTFLWEKPYHGPVLYSPHFNEMAEYLSGLASSEMNYREKLPNNLVLDSLINNDILYGMLKINWKPPTLPLKSKTIIISSWPWLDQLCYYQMHIKYATYLGFVSLSPANRLLAKPRVYNCIST